VRAPRTWALVAVALAALTSACRVDATVDLVVAPDGTGTVAVELVADAELVAAEPALAGELALDDLERSGWDVDGPRPTPDGGLRLVLRHPFTAPSEATRLLAQLSGPGGPLHDLAVTAVREGPAAVWRLEGRLELEGGVAGLVDTPLVEALGRDPVADALTEQGLAAADVFGLRLRATLPGEVTATSGTREPAAVVWTADPSGATATLVSARYELTDRGAERAERLGGIFRWAFAVYAAVLALVVVPVVVLRRRHVRRLRLRGGAVRQP
jgi:hypothetical protein